MPLKEIKQILYEINPIKFIELKNEELEKFAGEYKLKDNDIKKIIYEKGELFTLMEDGYKLLFKPIEKKQISNVGI